MKGDTMHESHGVKGGEGTIGSARSEKPELCDCDTCTARRVAMMIEAERGTLGTLPFPNAPTTPRLQ